MNTSPLYPLTFRPLFKRYLWGGRRLGEFLDKAIGDGDDYAESWEIVDHPQGQSTVASGPLAGTTLHELVSTRGHELLGRHAPQARFPLLFKYLDCKHDLSVQVHPNDAAARLIDPPDLGKTEAWVVLDARPGSNIYAGLAAPCDRAQLAEAIGAGRMEMCLHAIAARAGQCLLIPAGTIHALGAGLLVAEIQQSSDTTYRLYDWNRVGPDGRSRELHIEQGLAAVDLAAVRCQPQQPERTSRAHVERLAACDKFVLDRWTFEREQPIGGDDRFHILSVLEGDLQIRATPPLALRRGQTALLPASVSSAWLVPAGRCVALDMYLPD